VFIRQHKRKKGEPLASILSWHYDVRRARHLARRHAAADAIAFGLPNRTAEFGNLRGLALRNTGRGDIENLGMCAYQHDLDLTSSIPDHAR
jgi:hypothetical protein